MQHWYRSFYWRIGLSFVVLVVVVLVAQSAMFYYLIGRSGAARPPSQSPNNRAAIVAADVGSMLTDAPENDVGRYVNDQYRGDRYRVYVVMKSGAIAANTAEPLSDDLRRSAEAILAGTDLRKAERPPV